MSRFWAWCQRHWLLSSLFLCLAAGFIAFWSWLGPLPASRQAERPRAMTADAAASPASSAPAVHLAAATAHAADGGRAAVWRKAFAAQAGLTLRQAMHRAAVSGRLEDIVVARQFRSRCGGLRGGLESGKDPVMPFRRAQQERAAQVEALCEGFLELGRRDFRLLDDGGDADGAQLLLGRASEARSAGAGQAMLDYLRRQQSPELLEAVFHQLYVTKAWKDLGWIAAKSFDSIADEYLLWHAIALAACESQGDCRTPASERFHCAMWGDCVDDLRELVSQYVLVPEGQRARTLALFPREQLGAFLAAAEQKLAQLGRNPAEIEQIRAELVGLCTSTECLAERWQLAQRRAECLIGRRAMVECAATPTPPAS